jgi:hypothetical protein
VILDLDCNRTWKIERERNILSPRTPIPPNIPLLLPPLPPLLANLLTRNPLVITVLPLPYTLANLHPSATVVLLLSLDILSIPILIHPRQRQPQIQQFQRPLRSPARRDIHVREIARHDEAVGSYQGAAGCADPLLAGGGEGDVGCAGVAAGEGPGCFAVADYEDAGGCHCALLFFFVSLGWSLVEVSGCEV